ncbi:hypothetical protein VNO80_25475 [Phaseolus coccineus]|uniref:Uncharacterized protein n=1 Tax=Phaseolus coccineus TaxID=3886 RepID=A0AAN9LUB0_PHACN
MTGPLFFEDWRVGFPSGNEERDYGGPDLVIAEVEQFRGVVKGEVGAARSVDGDGQDRLGVKGFVTSSSMAHDSGKGGVSREKDVLLMEAVADKVGVARKVGMGRAESSRWNDDPENIVGDSRITKMEKVKDLACFLETNVVNGTPNLVDREVEDYKGKGIEATSSPFEESNLVEVRVV